MGIALDRWLLPPLVDVRDRVIERIEWTPAARPFFEKGEPWCPQGDSNP
jgi:hypothetical protein